MRATVFVRGADRRADNTRRRRAPESTGKTTEDSIMAKKSGDVRPKITLACTECKERNYITKKNRRNTPDRLELSKFCPRCGRHTAHRETR